MKTIIKELTPEQCLAFVREVANLQAEGDALRDGQEDDDNGEGGWEMPIDDAFDTVSRLISDARSMLSFPDCWARPESDEKHEFSADGKCGLCGLAKGGAK